MGDYQRQGSLATMYHVPKLGKIPTLALLLALLTFESQQCYVLDQTVTALQHRQLQGLHDGGFS